ncbi:hypothetical protein B0H16DRAFT_1478360 [Mycena metata]|uniref:Uncharacterized protein n=1 Tax=Mycena metata TaxID=1033252 RepID=A0AAD7MFB2_9AGAR|nr:hypothetical protein B0H16DRAFT_1478360 [Mycena metata]
MMCKWTAKRAGRVRGHGNGRALRGGEHAGAADDNATRRWWKCVRERDEPPMDSDRLWNEEMRVLIRTLGLEASMGSRREEETGTDGRREGAVPARSRWKPFGGRWARSVGMTTCKDWDATQHEEEDGHRRVLSRGDNRPDLALSQCLTASPPLVTACVRREGQTEELNAKNCLEEGVGKHAVLKEGRDGNGYRLVVARGDEHSHLTMTARGHRPYSVWWKRFRRDGETESQESLVGRMGYKWTRTGSTRSLASRRASVAPYILVHGVSASAPINACETESQGLLAVGGRGTSGHRLVVVRGGDHLYPESGLGEGVGGAVYTGARCKPHAEAQNGAVTYPWPKGPGGTETASLQY